MTFVTLVSSSPLFGPATALFLLLAPSKFTVPLTAPRVWLVERFAPRKTRKTFSSSLTPADSLIPGLQSFHPHHPAAMNVKITSLTNPVPFFGSCFSLASRQCSPWVPLSWKYHLPCLLWTRKRSLPWLSSWHTDFVTRMEKAVLHGTHLWCGRDRRIVWCLSYGLWGIAVG